ncbi:MAG: TIM barrel protein [Caldilineaceae bacterium]
MGRPPIYGPDTAQPAWTPPADALPLLDLPAKLADFGIRTLEICHFSLPSTVGYLADLRAALDHAGVELWSLLIDGGDITHPEHGARDLAWIEDWLPVAAALGARNVRAVAGMQPPTPVTVDRSVTALRRIMDAAEQHGVHVMTENWHALMDGPDVVTEIRPAAGRRGPLFRLRQLALPGQIRGPGRHRPVRRSCHAKCALDAAGTPDAADYARCLRSWMRPDSPGRTRSSTTAPMPTNGAGWRWNGDGGAVPARVGAAPIPDPRASDLTGANQTR